MTRGQDSLVIDAGQTSRAAVSQAAADLRLLVLPVRTASAEECLAHEAVLAEIDAASAGKTVWRAPLPV